MSSDGPGDDGAPSANMDTLPAADAPAIATPADRFPEAVAARYQLGIEVGRGGLGRVLRAHDRVLDRTVAIKELFGDDEGTRRRFVREALITARLQHPAIVPLYEAGRWRDRSPFYAMKLVGGRPLSDAIAKATTLEARLAMIPTVLAVADAIAYAHSERIVHRDLKPGNVLVGDFGETVVIDWGLAKDIAIDDRDALDAGPYREVAGDQTMAGAVLGTPAYMAPEQAAGDPTDERADVYAIGAMLYHLVSGVIPHQGDSLAEVIRKVLTGDIVPLAVREPRAPADLAAIVAKAMALDLEARYRTARELAEDLRQFQTGQLVGAHRYGVGERVRRWVRKHRAVTTVAAVATVVLLVFGIWSISRILAETDRADRERDLAVLARDQAIGEANRALLAQARGALARDAAEALAWLARMDSDNPAGWEGARVTAAAALARPRLVHHLDGLPGVEAAVSPARGHALVWGAQASAVIDLASGETIVLDHRLTGARPLFCDDGRHLVVEGTAPDADAPTLLRIDLETGGVQPTPGCTPVAGTLDLDEIRRRMSAIASTPLQIETISRNGRVGATLQPMTNVIDLDSGTERTIQYPGSAVALGPDGSWIAVAQADGAIRIYDTRTGTHTGTLDHAGVVTWLDVSPDGSRLLALGDRPAVWDLLGRRAPLPLTGQRDGVWGSIGDHDAVTIGADLTMRVWRLDTDHRALALPQVGVASFSADGRWLLLASSRQLARVDVDGGAPALVDADSPPVVASAIDRDGTVVLARADGALQRWTPGKPLETLAPRHQPADDGTPEGTPAPAIALAGGWLALTRSPRDPVRLVDLATGTSAELPGSAGLAAAFSPDGATLATGADDGGILVWDVATRRPTRLATAPDQVWAIAFSGDGRTLAAAGPGAITVVELASQRASTLDGEAGPITAIAMSPAGDRVVARQADGTLLLWSRPSGELRRVEMRFPHALHVGADVVTAAGSHGLVTIRDDLPRDPAALAAILRALPYRLDDRGRLSTER